MDSSELSSDHTCYRNSIGDKSNVLEGLEKDIIHYYACCMALRHSSSGSKEVWLRLCLVIRSQKESAHAESSGEPCTTFALLISSGQIGCTAG